MLVAHSYEWTAYAMIDYVLRLTGGLTLPAAQDVPFRILTKDVIKKAIEDYKDDFDGFHEICFGDEFVTGYNRQNNGNEAETSDVHCYCLFHRSHLKQL